MPRISVPADRDPLLSLWTERAPTLTSTAGACNDAVYRASALPLQEFEAARTRIAKINVSEICRGWCSARDVASRAAEPGEINEELCAHVGVDPSWPGSSERERFAAEFAERFALDHRRIDDVFSARLHDAFTDLVDVGLCVASWVAFGRLNRVFDGACRADLTKS